MTPPVWSRYQKLTVHRSPLLGLFLPLIAEFAALTLGGATTPPPLVPPPAIPASQIDPYGTLNLPGRSAQRLASAVPLPYERTLPGPIEDWVLLAVDGGGAKEYYLQFKSLGPQGYRYAQRRGRASQGMKPMWALANQRTGQGLALMLAYMGNWTFAVGPGDSGTVSVKLATSPEKLTPFTEINGLSVPGALVAEFTGHWDNGTQPMVRFIRERLLRDLGPQWPLVQYNTWYDLFDKITQQRLVDAASVARDIGCELFTIDAGWFGEGLEAKWTNTVGDWQVNRTRLPKGLEAISSAVHRLGMKFGLWFEIERASPASRLASKHPDWFLTDPQGRPLSTRGMLNFGKPEVLAHVKQVLSDAVRQYSLDYIKMDFNTDPAIENQELAPAADPLYRHYQGMAQLWTYLREHHPNLIVEDCSSGARRHELTAAALTDTHWISDTIANQPNLLIMFGATYFFPASTCSHWTARPDARDPVLNLDAQFVINMMGHFGLSGPIASWDAETRTIATTRVAQYKHVRPVICAADVFHLTTPQLGAMQAALYVDPGTGRAVLFAFQGGDPALAHTIPLRGLDPLRRYRLTVPGAPNGRNAPTGTMTGSQLVAAGLPITFPSAGAAALVEIEPVEK